MPRNAASSARIATATATASTVVVATADAPQKPANDGGALAVAAAGRPSYALSATQRAHVIALSMALDPSQLKPVPAWVHAQLAWMDGIQATAWRDRAELARIPLGGKAISEAELDDMGRRIEFARDMLVDDEVPVGGVATRDPSRMSDPEIVAEVHVCQGVICDALTPYFAFSTAPAKAIAAQRSAVRKVRRDRAASDVTANNKRIFRLYTDPDIRTWLHALPKEELVMLARLRVLHAARSRRTTHDASGTARDVAPRDLALRAYNLALETLLRVTTAGRYLIKGRADREGDYPGFKRPKARTTAAKVSATGAETTPTDAKPATP